MWGIISLLTRPGHDEAHLSQLKLWLGLAALSALVYEFWRRKEGRPIAAAKKKWFAAATAVAAVIAYFQCFQLPHRDYFHRWDFYHHYIGARYQRELQYEWFYECAAVAESQLPDAPSAPGARPRQPLQGRQIRDLHQHRGLIEASEALEHPERCTERFTPERWAAYRADIDFFRTVMQGKYWAEAQRAPGYSITPAQAALTAALLPGGPPTVPVMQALASLDVALTAAMFGLIAWAFGWRVMCLAVVFWGVQALAPFYWMGGALLRQGWIVCVVGSVCLARRGRSAASGALLSLGALLWVLPVGFFLGPLLLAASLRRPRPRRRLLRFFAGAAVAGALTLATTSASSWGAWANHAQYGYTALTNLVGWRTAVTYRADNTIEGYRQQDPESDPYDLWQQKRGEIRRERAWLWWGSLAAGMAAFGLACLRDRRPWVSLALGATPVFLLFEAPCYFAIYLLPLCLLARARPRLAAPLLLAATLTQLCALEFRWLDQRFAASSLVVAALLALCTGAIAGRSRRAQPRARLAAAG